MKRWIHASKDYKKLRRSNVNASTSFEKDYLDPDLYVIKIWHEVAPGRDKGVPVADEEIFEVYATDPQDAIEQAKQQWSGPIDRIEIVAINPEVDTDEELPFI